MHMREQLPRSEGDRFTGTEFFQYDRIAVAFETRKNLVEKTHVRESEIIGTIILSGIDHCAAT